MVLEVVEQIGIFSRGFDNWRFDCKTVNGTLAEWISERLEEGAHEVVIFFP